MKTIARFASIALAVGCLGVLPAMRVPPRKTVQFADSRLVIELNSTDGDVGVQAFIDSEEPWDRVIIEAPDGHKLFDVRGKGNLGKLGSTELFFESEEPSFDEMSLADFLLLFPEGTYHFSGTTVDGEKLTGSAEFTHDIPAGPVIESPTNGATLDPANVVIDWDPVTDPPGIQISRYEVIVEEGDVEPPRTFDVFVPAAVTSLTVPSGFFLSGRPYNLEVLAWAVGDNHTITEGNFVTK
jgi:hypothetical protein